MANIVVSLTYATDNPERATVAFVVANTALASDVQTAVFLNIEGVRLGVEGGDEGAHVPSFQPLAELIATFGANGGQIWVCPPCFQARGLEGSTLVPGAVMAGSAKLVEALATGWSCVSY